MIWPVRGIGARGLENRTGFSALLKTAKKSAAKRAEMPASEAEGGGRPAGVWKSRYGRAGKRLKEAWRAAASQGSGRRRGGRGGG